MKRKLKLSPDLSFPVDAVTETFGFMARRGGGKTYCAQKLAEEMLEAGAQIVALDPIGNWWSLRLAANGKSKCFDIPVFGGLYGDIPLAPSSGKLVADTIADTGTSVVLDVSQFTKADRKRFVTDFCERLFMRRKREPSATHIFFEECQVFCPQRVSAGDARMVGAVEDIVRQGRNHGLGATMISQRPQSVNKEILNQVECLFMMQLNGAHERKAIENWIDYKGVEAQDVVDELPGLKPGEAWVWSPQLLEDMLRVTIGTKKSFDASSAPKVGATSKARKIAKLDMAKLEKAMVSVVETQEANDPAKLRREIVCLKKEIAKKGNGISAEQRREIEGKAIKTAVETTSAAYEKRIKGYRADLDKLHKVAEKMSANLNAVIGRVAETVETQMRARTPLNNTLRQAKRPPPRPTEMAKTTEGVSRPQQRILDALAWFEAVGNDTPKKIPVAFLAGVSSKSSGYQNNLSAMRTAGLVDYPGSGTVCLTDEGRACANAPDAPTTSEHLQEMFYVKLPNPQADLLRAAVERWPEDGGKDEIAVEVGKSPISSGVQNNYSALKTLGVITYSAPGRVRAADMLFLE